MSSSPIQIEPGPLTLERPMVYLIGLDLTGLVVCLDKSKTLGSTEEEKGSSPDGALTLGMLP